MNINEIDKLVADYLNEIGVKYEVLGHVDLSKNDDWPCDRFTVAFNGVNFDFRTGLGHRVAHYENCNDLKAITGIRRVRYSVDAKINTKNGVKQACAVIPIQAAVLYCLLSDMLAAQETFFDWCDSYGYNSDSFKDFDIYQKCNEIAVKLKNVFTREQINHLSDLLSDY